MSDESNSDPAPTPPRRPARPQRTTAPDSTEPPDRPIDTTRTQTPRSEVEAARAAWAPVGEGARGWVPRPWVPAEERARVGRETRQRVPRTSHATLELPTDRDPIAILTEQEHDRLADLIPIRHFRMAESAFAYYRGAPAVMAADLAPGARTGLIVQASGDAHISNFGLFGSPERTLVFDANDFDETLAAPWEWDVKRLAASVVIAGRANAFTPAQSRAATLDAVGTYRKAMAEYATMRLIDVWYDKITAEDIEVSFRERVTALEGAGAVKDRSKTLDALFAKARRKDRLRATDSLTTKEGGEWRIVDDPPVVSHVEIPGGGAALAKTFIDYRASMAENRRELVERYRFVDFALKVVGVGSVGTRCFIVLLEGRDEQDPLILQAKEATASVLEAHAGSSGHSNHGERVVVGQRLMQATPDIFLGWTRGPGGRDFYFRQLWDMKGSIDITVMQPMGLAYYAGLCARSLARAHARSGDALAISSYLGTSDTFDGAIADWSEAYADQNERDHAAFKAAISDGRIESKPG